MNNHIYDINYKHSDSIATSNNISNNFINANCDTSPRKYTYWRRTINSDDLGFDIQKSGAELLCRTVEGNGGNFQSREKIIVYYIVYENSPMKFDEFTYSNNTLMIVFLVFIWYKLPGCSLFFWNDE
ncbi:hypothetical protein RclHR1_08690002 [Rhizophagus clarus]|uniref:Uncharacterized protein n=1 Tax=Rhizophagus clarus TaxID=94130 RepID=A0A2Z6SNX0_9GLOM|nr:hypothetical protein RclHR1_08690002 [Rhizophagus clarus]